MITCALEESMNTALPLPVKRHDNGLWRGDESGFPAKELPHSPHSRYYAESFLRGSESNCFAQLAQSLQISKENR
jgi:hypothetical protein